MKSKKWTINDIFNAIEMNYESIRAIKISDPNKSQVISFLQQDNAWLRQQLVQQISENLLREVV